MYKFIKVQIYIVIAIIFSNFLFLVTNNPVYAGPPPGGTSGGKYPSGPKTGPGPIAQANGVYTDKENMFVGEGGVIGGSHTQDIQVAGSGTAQEDNLIIIIKSAINRILGLLALIALCILLRGGFQMLTAAGDDGKFKNGMTYLTQAGTGLIYIGVARFMVSIIFYVIKLVTT